jgi:hypothetical protein
LASNQAWTQQLAMQRKGWIDASGSRAEYATRNPDWSITQMLQQLAAACATDGVHSSVHVDRFTEFEVLFEFDEKPTPGQMSSLALCVLSRNATYPSTIRFAHDHQLVAEIDARDIQSVTNWQAAGESVVLAFVNRSSKGQSISPTAEGKTEPEADTERDPNEVAARLELDQVVRAQFASLNDSIQLQSKSTQLNGLDTLELLQQRYEELHRAETNFQFLKPMLLDPSVELERILLAHKVRPLIVKIMVRGSREQSEPVASARAPLFDLLIRHNRAMKEYLELLEKHWGEWSVVPGGAKIQLQNQSLSSVYKERLAEAEALAMQVEKALADWK